MVRVKKRPEKRHIDELLEEIQQFDELKTPYEKGKEERKRLAEISQQLIDIGESIAPFRHRGY